MYPSSLSADNLFAVATASLRISVQQMSSAALGLGNGALTFQPFPVQSSSLLAGSTDATSWGLLTQLSRQLLVELSYMVCVV